MRRDPDSRNRVSRLNPVSERVTIDVPELRIVSDELWEQVQEVLRRRAGQPLVYRKRPRHLFSGLIQCGLCGGSMTIVADTRLACSRAREAGTCGHNRRLQLGELQARVLAGLEEQLLSPEAVSILVREFHLERERKLREGGRARAARERQLAKAVAAVERLVAAIADGGGEFAELRQALARKIEERDRARAELGEEDAVPVIVLHPQIVEAYRQHVRRITAAIAAGEPLSDQVKADIRGLVEAIHVTPAEAGGHAIEFTGSLESAVALATGRPAARRGAPLAVTVVAEEGLEPPTRGL